MYGQRNERERRQDKMADYFVLEGGDAGARRDSRPKWSFWSLCAAVSGMCAIALGAYGAHLYSPDDADFLRVFHTANYYHLFHTLLLAFSPFTRRPNFIGVLCVFGILLFSGSCYVSAIMEDKKYGWGAPFGGFCFIGAWTLLAF